ncbi:MAG: peptide chain release factor N(5)-glutamine methyltransferase [Anaerolineales bacterium]|nr:peptide chain release factor N(5)-glutamine methyltransferase [Anaerolineales bacterium]
MIRDQQAQEFTNMLNRCQLGEALPYVLGWWEFYGRRFHLSPAVMIPRPETEQMVEASLEYLSGRSYPPIVIDVGTGSGCVAVTLAAEMPGLRIFASDISSAALTLARRNILEHNVSSQIELVRSDLLVPFDCEFDLICANLPYIPTGELKKIAVGRREPHLALDGGADGLKVIRRLMKLLPDRLAQGGRALLEIGVGQDEAVLDLASKAVTQVRCEVRRDLAGLQRLVVIDRT